MTSAIASEFLFDDPRLPRPRRGTKRWYVEEWTLWRQLCLEHGGLTPPTMAKYVLGVSKQRVFQLIESGRLRSHRVFDREFVGCDELERFAQLDRPPGRPWHREDDAEVSA
jgi:hypothetical protein